MNTLLEILMVLRAFGIGLVIYGTARSLALDFRRGNQSPRKQS